VKRPLVLLLVAAAGACAPVPAATLSVAAASDLRYALDELTGIFTRSHPDIRVEVAYGSSGNFYAQIVNGAPFDLFLSADVAYARQLDDQGLTHAGSFFRYAHGRIAVWVPASSPLDVEQRGLSVLTDRSVANVAIANPQHAPYGRAAEAALRSAGMFDLVEPRLVLGENVSQALQFVQSGGADAGIVALSLAVAPSVAAGGRYWVIPEDMHPPIDQGGVIVRSTKRAPAAESLRAFLLGDEARGILQRYGFGTS
jgi:molybdate transport system substrate-binding protein